MATRPRRATATKSRPPIDSSDSDAENNSIKPTTKPIRKTSSKRARTAHDMSDVILLDSEIDSPAPVKKSSKSNAIVAKVSTGTAAKPRSAATKSKKALSVNDIDCSPPAKKIARSSKLSEVTETTNIAQTSKSTSNTKKAIASNPSSKPTPRITADNPTTIANRRLSSRFTTTNNCKWNPAQQLADQQQLDYATAQQIVRLFDEDNTIPFMCRYRRELIGDLTPEQMRDVKITYNHILNVKSKADTMLRHLDKENVCTDELRSDILHARSLDELEHLYAPYKPASKLALSERAKAIGLQAPAESLLYGESFEQPLLDYVNMEVPGLESLLKIHEGMQHIGAHLMSKDARILEELRRLQKCHRIQLASKLIPQKRQSKNETDKPTKSAKAKPVKPVDPSKFETYFEFRQSVVHIRPHQVLAINRGESLKVLNVKVEIPDSLRHELHRFARNVYLNSDGRLSVDREKFFEKSFDEAYTKKLQPLISRQIRGELTKSAETASVEVFATNLKQLLLMSPVKGERILGIDPGFSNGCKLALISEQTAVLDTDVIYPHTRQHQSEAYGVRVAAMMRKHRCRLIALGNGTACRETERWLGGLMTAGVLDAELVRYCIVSEQGASIYSCSDVARQEFQTLDVNLISAVSIARRLNDPLGELVKVEPRHLGVGMYQHDVNEKLLTETLNEVVMECVSFVGVDLNTASVALLRHVAGLTAARAANICAHRDQNGPFVTREQLKSVKQIGEKTFVQCAGFVRIEPLTAGGANAAHNPLDSTWVHPESYALAQKLVAASGAQLREVGTAEGIRRISALMACKPVAQLASEFGAAEERVASVLSALQRELLRDYRCDLDKKPMFKQGLTQMADLRSGTAVSGAITNQTHFGCFVDIGVECDGLIHASRLGGMRPNIGDRVDALVLDVDVSRKRIQLQLVAIC